MAQWDPSVFTPQYPASVGKMQRLRVIQQLRVGTLGPPQTLTCAALGLGAVGQHFCPEHRHLTSLSSMGPSRTATPGQSAPYMVAQSTSTLLLSSEVRGSTLSLPKLRYYDEPTQDFRFIGSWATEGEEEEKEGGQGREERRLRETHE